MPHCMAHGARRSSANATAAHLQHLAAPSKRGLLDLHKVRARRKKMSRRSLIATSGRGAGPFSAGSFAGAAGCLPMLYACSRSAGPAAHGNLRSWAGLEKGHPSH